MFATGVENSDPTIERGRVRIDEMEKCCHYKNWRTDLDCVQELGVCFLRYGVPLHRVFLAPGKYDWEFADLAFNEIRRQKLIPIVDLCHFGVPDWLGYFQNVEFPLYFAEYAEAFARRFSWVLLLHASQRDVHLRHILLLLRLVERGTQQRSRLWSPPLTNIVKAHVPGDARHLEKSG